jgi:hypothetical protein
MDLMSIAAGRRRTKTRGVIYDAGTVSGTGLIRLRTR